MYDGLYTVCTVCIRFVGKHEKHAVLAPCSNRGRKHNALFSHSSFCFRPVLFSGFCSVVVIFACSSAPPCHPHHPWYLSSPSAPPPSPIPLALAFLTSTHPSSHPHSSAQSIFPRLYFLFSSFSFARFAAPSSLRAVKMRIVRSFNFRWEISPGF